MSRATLVLDGPRARAQASLWVSKVPAGTRLEFKAPRRSLDQNALMWVLLTHVAQQVIWYGEKLTPEDWKDVFTASLKRAKVVPGLDGGFVPLGMRTSDMSVEEMTALIELIHAFCAERGVDLHDGQETGRGQEPRPEAA